MPVFNEGKGRAPSWCELEEFELVALKEGESRVFSKETAKEELMLCRGGVVVEYEGAEITLAEGGKLDLNSSGKVEYALRSARGGALACRLKGRWRSVTSSGIFGAKTAEPRKDDTPYSYKKTTGFDNHYHDCDEYWIVIDGVATVYSEGKLYNVHPGDCVATGMGWHHDVAAVEGDKPLKAIWFEGTLEGAMRTGHLWEPKHGKAAPKTERV